LPATSGYFRIDDRRSIWRFGHDRYVVEILSVDPFSRAELLSSLKRTRLRGGADLYTTASLGLRSGTNPGELAPAQRYVLAPTVEKVLELREAVLAEGVDIFALDGGMWVRTSDDPDELTPVIPPIVEESIERDGRTVLVIADGIHRIYAAKSIGAPISVVTVHGVPKEHPYYAYALDEGWDGVRELAELPDNFQKKEYRRPDNYKSLFRDYNAIFPGVQKQRKQSNPAFLAP
jgi:hypothetical protein